MIILEDLIRVQMDERLREAELARRRRHLSGTRPNPLSAPSLRPQHGRKSSVKEPKEMNAAPTRRARAIRFAVHYLEMVLAMVVGMVVLSPVWNWLGEALNVSALFDRPDLGALIMATDMTIAMSAWMRFRGHRWAPVAEMAAAMYLPFIVLFVPLWTGFISGGTLMVAGHVLMLPAMAVAMFLRLDEYTHHHHAGTGKAGQPLHVHEHS